MSSWDLTVQGQDYVVSVDRGENGKDTIRINGRVAAKPMNADETERSISVGGAAYIVRRDGNAFDIVQDEWADPLVTSRHTANTVLAHAGEIPVSARKRDASSFIPMIGWALLIGIVGAGMFFFVRMSRYDNLAKIRVGKMLKDMKSGKDVDMEGSVDMWALGRRLDSMQKGWASDNFTRWRQEKDLYQKTFSTYEVTECKLVDGAATPTANVTFKLDDAEYHIVVPKGNAIYWEDGIHWLVPDNLR
jgi:hypothetical protein